MRTLLTILLMVLLPLQASWGAAAEFCRHENEASTAWHWGHHLACKMQTNTKAVKHKPLVCHCDHLKISHQAIELQTTSNSGGGFIVQMMHFPSFAPVLYQSPILEQPEPPSWSA